MRTFILALSAFAIACGDSARVPLHYTAKATSDADSTHACPSTRYAVLVLEDSLRVSLAIAPENRCSTYNRNDYSYPQSVEEQIAARQGMVSLYTGQTFAALSESDIEHIVALSEAHDSGMCAASRDERRAFARDLDNLTLADPHLNRYDKRAKDAAEWLPPLASAHCWFAGQVVLVKGKYGLSVDQAEYDALKAILDGCAATP